jgi:hypothetical protein
MDSFILKRLSQIHQEYLVFILGPVHDVMPNHHCISSECSVFLAHKFRIGRPTLEVILYRCAEELTDLSHFFVFGPSANGDLDNVSLTYFQSSG